MSLFTPPPPDTGTHSPYANLPPEVSTITLDIGQADIERGTVGRFVDDLLHLSDSPELARRFAHSLSLQVSGLRQYLMPAHQQAPVRRFVQALDQQWPYWSHFLRPEPEQWATLLACILPPRPSALHDTPGAVRFDQRELGSLMLRYSTATHRLHAEIGLSPAQSEAMHRTTMLAIRSKTGRQTPP